MRGRAYYYRLTGWKDHPENIRMQLMEQHTILKQFDKDLSFHKLPVVKYGAAVHRLGAREAPGEVERQTRKTRFRKSTRN